MKNFEDEVFEECVGCFETVQLVIVVVKKADEFEWMEVEIPKTETLNAELEVYEMKEVDFLTIEAVVVDHERFPAYPVVVGSADAKYENKAVGYLAAAKVDFVDNEIADSEYSAPTENYVY